jgi:hypothetical protein
MKKLKEVKNLHNLFVDSMNELDTKLQLQFKKIKKEYQENVINEKYRLLLEISNGESLDFDKMKNKYLKSKEISTFNDSITKTDEKMDIDENLLDKIDINGKEYYYEAKENGIVYDSLGKAIGIFKNGKIKLN